MADRLFIGVIGEPDSGKSTTWYSLFWKPLGKRIRSNGKPRELEITEDKKTSVNVIVINRSPIEENKPIAEILEGQECEIILCSLRYEGDENSFEYIKEFKDNFDIHIQWLNPGYSDDGYSDYKCLIAGYKLLGACIYKKNGKKDENKLAERVDEIRTIIKDWASNKPGLLIYK